MKTVSLGDRMKDCYESISKTRLTMRMPVVLRLDGRAFHTLTKKLKLEKPFDTRFMDIMDSVALRLCEEIQGAQVAYLQSDEISILIHNYKKLNSGSWFDNEVQKMVSVSAGIASAMFTKQIASIYKVDLIGTFDARAFVLPEKEVNNLFLWRQLDCERNSVQMLAQSLYSHKELHGKNSEKLQDMCVKKGKNWNNLPVSQKRGRCVVKIFQNDRSLWAVDSNIPIFSKDPNYINKFLVVEEE